MTSVGFLTDEHVPGPFVTTLRSIGYDVLRAKDQFREGTEDGVLLEFGDDADRVVIKAVTARKPTPSGVRGSAYAPSGKPPTTAGLTP